MPFDWMQADVPPLPPGRWRDQHVRAIRERARLLYNLGFSQELAVTRIQASLAWEFDADFALTPLPSFYAEVPELVASTYARSSRGQA
jgi:hypothetical protein